MEEGKKKIALVEALGWKENRAYKCSYGIYKIVDGTLFLQDSLPGAWRQSKLLWTDDTLNALINAEPTFKKYMIPLPWLATSDGYQQYLSYDGRTYFASRENRSLKQTWDEREIVGTPYYYQQFKEEVSD